MKRTEYNLIELTNKNKKAKLKEAKTNRYSLTIKDEERPHTLLKLEYSNYDDLIDTLETIGMEELINEIEYSFNKYIEEYVGVFL